MVLNCDLLWSHCTVGSVLMWSLLIPAVSLGVMFIAMEVALGWRMVTWGIAVVKGSA